MFVAGANLKTNTTQVYQFETDHGWKLFYTLEIGGFGFSGFSCLDFKNKRFLLLGGIDPSFKQKSAESYIVEEDGHISTGKLTSMMG